MGKIDLRDDTLKNVRAVIWKRENNQTFFLLTQEFSGGFTLPGGCKDLEDTDLRTALYRELREEIGLHPEDYSAIETNIQKEYESLYGDSQSERFGKNTIIYIFIISNLLKEPIPSGEIKDVMWMTEEEALKVFNTPHMKELFRLGIKVSSRLGASSEKYFT